MYHASSFTFHDGHLSFDGHERGHLAFSGRVDVRGSPSETDRHASVVPRT